MGDTWTARRRFEQVGIGESGSSLTPSFASVAFRQLPQSRVYSMTCAWARLLRITGCGRAGAQIESNLSASLWLDSAFVPQRLRGWPPHDVFPSLADSGLSFLAGRLGVGAQWRPCR